MRRANRTFVPPKKNENYFEKKFKRRAGRVKLKDELPEFHIVGQMHYKGASPATAIRDYFAAKHKKRGKSKFNLQKRHNKIMFPLWKMRSFRGSGVRA